MTFGDHLMRHCHGGRSGRTPENAGGEDEGRGATRPTGIGDEMRTGGHQERDGRNPKNWIRTAVPKSTPPLPLGRKDIHKAITSKWT